MTKPTAAISKELPFKRSWIDRFNEWVEELPVHAWIFYAVFGIVLILVQILFLWFDSGMHAEQLLLVIIFNALAVPYLLALINLLDKQALTAMYAMRPVLDMTEQDFDSYKYELVNMPFLAPLLVGAVLAAITILTPFVATEPFRYAALEQLPVFAVVFHIVDTSSAFFFGVLLYHTIRQLYLVNLINANYIRISLLDLRPVHAFSKLSASTALGLVMFVYLWMFINPELLMDPVIMVYAALFTILAVSVFIWPLRSVHKLLESEKEGALQKNDRLFDAVLPQFNQYICDGNFAAAEKLNGTITSLEIQHQRITAVPTWPWRSETARVILTAVAFPLMLMMLRFLMQVVLLH